MLDPSFNEPESQTEWAETLHIWIFRAKVQLKKYWWVFLLTTLLGVCWQAYTSYVKPPVYESYARMIVSGRIALQENSVYNEELSNFFGTQIVLMQSPRVQRRAHDRVAALHPDLKRIKVTLSAAQMMETSIFILSTSGSEPKYTQAFLDACLQEYGNFRKEMRSTTSKSTLLAITGQLMSLEEEIEKGENALVDFQKVNNIVFIQEQGSSAGSYLAKLKNKMAGLKTNYQLLESLSLEQHLENSPAKDISDAHLKLASLDTSANYQEAKLLLDQINAEIEEYSIYLKPAHPKIIRYQQEIERMENLLKIYRKQGLSQLDDQKHTVRSQITNLGKVVLEWEGTALDYSRRLAEYHRLNTRLERSRGHYQRLLASIQSIDLSTNLEQETITILEHASKPDPNGVKLDVLAESAKGGISGFILGAGLVFLASMVDNRLMSAEDLKQRFDIPVLGVLPKEKIPHSGRMDVLADKDQRHLFAEACRTIRSSLLFMDLDGPPPRTFVITSAIPTEGKSTVSSNLGITLAFASSRTLLIDADLRRGLLHKVLDKKKSPGLSDYFLKNKNIDQIVQKTHVENLDFIACGAYPHRPSEMLLSSRMEDFLREAQEQYEYVIFDSAPVLAADDTPSFASKIDAVIFTVRSNYTQARHVKASIDRLQMRGGNLVGFVLNFVDIKGADYYYYNKYNSSYAYGPPQTSEIS